MTRAQIQALIDALPSIGAIPTGTVPVGGQVPIPAGTHTLDGPIQMDNGVWLNGSGPDCQLIYDHATDPVVGLTTRGGHNFITAQRISNMNISNPSGPQIGFTSTTDDEWADLYFHDLTLAGGGDAVNLRKAHSRYGNAATLHRIVVKTCGGMPFTIKSRLMDLAGLKVINCTKAGLNPTDAIFDLEGDGECSNMWGESSRGCPVYRFKGTGGNGAGPFVVKGGHIEPRQGVSDGVPYWVVIDGATVEMDEVFFAGPEWPVHFMNGGELILTRYLRTDDGNGGATNPLTCYTSDGNASNRLVFGGRTYFGRAINPVATIPVRR